MGQGLGQLIFLERRGPGSVFASQFVKNLRYVAAQGMQERLMTELKREIAAYRAISADLESSSLGKWAVVHDEKLFGVFDSFEAAAKQAVQNFGRGPYLIRQIGASAVTLPASVLYHPVHG